MSETITRFDAIRWCGSVAYRYQWAGWLLVAAVGVHIIEALARIGPSERTYWQELPKLIPIYAVTGLGFFYGFRRDAEDALPAERKGAPTFLLAWAVFIGYITASRVLLTWLADEPLTPTVWFALGVIVLGLFLTHSVNRWLIALGLFVAVGSLVLYGNELQKKVVDQFTLGWWMLLLFLGCISIAYHEYNSRTRAFSKFYPHALTWSELRNSQFTALLWLTIIEGACLFYGYRWAEPSFIYAWSVYNVYDVIVRSVNVKLAGEQLYLSHVLGMVLVVLGTCLSLLGGLGM